jgi:hypothetical protein
MAASESPAGPGRGCGALRGLPLGGWPARGGAGADAAGAGPAPIRPPSAAASDATGTRRRRRGEEGLKGRPQVGRRRPPQQRADPRGAAQRVLRGSALAPAAVESAGRGGVAGQQRRRLRRLAGG